MFFAGLGLMCCALLVDVVIINSSDVAAVEAVQQHYAVNAIGK